ncbi:MAG: hypothetical protein ACMXYG_01620 [Candidatus Woesearchaeota archaeon]
MFEIGNVCVKIAGRDGGKICCVVSKIDSKTVLIDGETRRRKCNINHLEITDKTAKIKENATTQEIVKALNDINLNVKEKTNKSKTSKPRPRKIRVNNKKNIETEKKQETKN